MSALRMMAAALWTELVIAMRADGILSEDITQSGPATTAVILKACEDDAWFAMTAKPEAGKQVVAVTKDGRLHVLEIDTYGGSWLYSSGRAYADPKLFDKWAFVRVPK